MRQKLVFGGFMAVFSIFSQLCIAQPAGGIERPEDWQWGVFVGYMSGDTLIKTHDSGGEPVTAKADSGVEVGVRVGMDREFIGWEVSARTVFSDLEIDADPAADVPSGGDADLYLLSVDLLWYPTGNELDQGRFRPFMAFGPGIGFYDSDFDEVDGEWLYDISAGAGFKLLTGDEGNPVVRFDWRWHLMDDFSDDFEWVYQQEFSLGVGFRF